MREPSAGALFHLLLASHRMREERTRQLLALALDPVAVPAVERGADVTPTAQTGRELPHHCPPMKTVAWFAVDYRYLGLRGGPHAVGAFWAAQEKFTVAFFDRPTPDFGAVQQCH
jgi:hypothetical protein